MTTATSFVSDLTTLYDEICTNSLEKKKSNSSKKIMTIDTKVCLRQIMKQIKETDDFSHQN